MKIVKKEFGFKPIYNMIDNLIVFVKNIPIVITMPSNIVIPIGGCSLPNLITLENLPYESVEI